MTGESAAIDRADRSVPAASTPVVVVGGGIAGLAVAYELSRQGTPFVLLERDSRPGGVILTERVDEFLIDAGPDSLLAQKGGAVQLCRELGLAERLQTTLKPRTAYVLRRGRLHKLPEASVMGIPTRLLPLATSPLFSLRGKARMGLDLVLPRRAPESGDESIGDFMRRRFGQEAVTYLAQPLLAGIHSGDVNRLSMGALFPRLVQAEAQRRSLILAFRAAPARPSADGIFRSLPGGIGELVHAIIAALSPPSIRTSAKVTELSRTADDRWTIALEGGDRITTSSVILCTPAYATADLLRRVDQRAADLCGEIRYASSATVALAYRQDQIARPLSGSGFVVPKTERQVRLMAGSFVSSKWPGRAPDRTALLRAFIGGARNPELLGRDDRDLARMAEEDFAALLGITGRPLFSRVYRWPRANAQHEVGHLERVARLEERLAASPGLFITGSAFRGTGITDCIADGRLVARQAAARTVHSGSSGRTGN